MKQLFVCIILCLAISTFADDCNNPLLTTLKLDKLLTPAATTGLKYCKSLQSSGKACCSPFTINSIQDKTAALAQKISDYVAARDKQLVNVRDTVIPQLKDSFQQFKDGMTQAYAQLDQMVAADQTGLMKTIMDAVKASMSAMVTNIETVYNNLGQYKTNLGDFQKSRSTCMVEILKLQASAYCLACDPAYATKGVSGSTVSMSDRVCQRLTGACYNYISSAATQNGMLYVSNLGSQLTAMASSMATGSLTFDLSSKSAALKSLSTDKLLAVQPAQKPTACNSATDCKWACSELFKNGVLSESLATLGGAEYSAPAGRRLLEEEEESTVERKLTEKRQRILGGSSWDPDQDEAGVSVTFTDDPGNANTQSASGSVLKVGVMCVIGMIVALF